MATIYDHETGDVIGAGIQGSDQCDAALIAARQHAAHTGRAIRLEDDDGTWVVQPNGFCERAGPSYQGWTARLSDGREVRVPGDLDPEIERWGVTAIVDWAREAGITSDGVNIRAIVQPDGDEITQF